MPGRRFTNKQEAEIAKRYLNGESLRALAIEFGTSHVMLSGSLRRQGVLQRDPSARNRTKEIDTHVFDVIDTEEKAYWLGFLFADGCVHGNYVILSLSTKDIEQIERFRSFLSSNHEIRTRKTPYAFNSSIYVADIHLSTKIMKLGIETGRPNPLSGIDSMPLWLQRHWIRGFFDGDGSVKIKPRASFCGDPILLHRLKEIMTDEVGNIGSIYGHQKGKVSYLEYTGRISCMKLFDYMYKDATIFMQRKFDRFNWCEPDPNYRNRPKINGRFVKKEALV